MSSCKSRNTHEISDIFHFAAIHFLPERHSAMILIYIYIYVCMYVHLRLSMGKQYKKLYAKMHGRNYVVQTRACSKSSFLGF